MTAQPPARRSSGHVLTTLLALGALLKALTACGAAAPGPSLAPGAPPGPSAPAATPAPAAPPAAPPVGPPTADPVTLDALPALDLALEQDVRCPRPSCPVPALFPLEVRASPRSPVVLWSHHFTNPGDAVDFQHVPESPTILFGVVVRGRVTLEHVVSVGLDGRPGVAAGRLEVPLWHAFRTRSGCGLVAAERGTRVVLALVSTHGPVEDARRAVPTLAPTPRDQGSGRGPPAPGLHPATVVGPAAVRAVRRPDGVTVFPLVDEGPTAPALALLWAPPHATIPAHQHDSWWEAIGVLGGEGVLSRATAEGGDLVPQPAAAGSTFVIAPGVRHGLALRGPRPLVAVQVRVPDPSLPVPARP
jgi:quercetin dioxygenase-like cupin family protein